ncbi:MAG TPA: hypothetical protein VN634_04000 [Candidatus Limnocylindrales bacterium]|nr:hypothetical protein [Candidatus Limnocylindrales bacterium]
MTIWADDDGSDACRFAAVAAAQQGFETRAVSGFSPEKAFTLAEAGLSYDFTEKLICRFLYVHGATCGRMIAREIGLPFRLIVPILSHLKNEMLLIYQKTLPVGDYEYALSDAGSERAKRFMSICTYAGTAPVRLDDYVASVAAQSLALADIGMNELEKAFADVLLEPEMLRRLGPAVNAGRGMFLYGAPGNGKTSIAERVVRCFGSDIWIPRTIMVEGVCIRLFDPVLHEEIKSPDSTLLGETLEDGRWVRIRRPTVVVGGELTMDQLELRHDPVSNVSEAPLQMKSNCGVLLIDDFGRQSMPVSQLLNRWIVPLEKRYDFQKLPTGKKIQVPFDQLVIFSTNLAPRDLVDEAFLRRLPYKIEIVDPTPDQFLRILLVVAPTLGVHPSEEQARRFIENYFRPAGRPMRCCQPRDLVLQMRSFCRFHRRPVEFSDEAMEFAIQNYFAVM